MARKVGVGPGIAGKAAALAAPIRDDIHKNKMKARLNSQLNSLREIRIAQKATKLVIPRAPFMRLVR